MGFAVQQSSQQPHRDGRREQMSASGSKCQALLALEKLEDRTAPAGNSLAAASLPAIPVSMGVSFPALAAMTIPVRHRSVTADLDGDGIVDLAIVNRGSRDVSVLLGLGDGAFGNEMRFPVGIADPDTLVVGDFSGNGHLDLAGISLESHEVFVLRGKGDGTFQ